MDNFRIDVTHEGSLNDVFKIVFGKYRKAVGYRVDEKRGLIFYWSKPGHQTDGYIDLPFKLDSEGAADFARRWLEEQNYGNEPDHDGDNGKGWRVYNEDWGHIDHHWEAFIAVQPVWAMYGK